jgi:hypothetical protein
MAQRRGDPLAVMMACLVCNSNEMVVLGCQEDEGVPPVVAVDVQCSLCDHITVIDIANATAQVAINFFVRCPARCREQETHGKI